LFLGTFFIIASNYFAVLAPQVTGYVVNKVEFRIRQMVNQNAVAGAPDRSYDPLVQWVAQQFEQSSMDFYKLIVITGLILLGLALLRGFFMFLMRQTIIVMSRLIEYDQKNEIYQHYQQLDAQFYKTHSTGDLMSRMAEDVSRVRMYTGPSVMHLIHLTALISLSLFYMFRKNWELTLYILTPLPILAVAIYLVNNIINKKSEQIQSQLSDLTTNAQESYAGIRVIKSFVQEKAMLGFFKNNSELYRKNAVSLAKVEAFYAPTMALMIGISTLLTIYLGGLEALQDPRKVGTVIEFVIYINMLTFPVSAIGWTASMIQRAAASQKRLNEFLSIVPAISTKNTNIMPPLEGNIEFNNVGFVYPHSGIHALSNFDLKIKAGQKVLVLGKTGSGKTSIAQLITRMYEANTGSISIDGVNVNNINTQQLRKEIGYVQQDVFLFSDSIENNIRFGVDASFTKEDLMHATQTAHVLNEINSLPNKFETLVGERGTTLSGGQKQRVAIARALLKKPNIYIFDDCLSAVDANTEQIILSNLKSYIHNKTALFITHRIFYSFQFDLIIYLEDGKIAEMGTHDSLLAKNGLYAELYRVQQTQEQH
jgi:ATP-binding cassette subfamily B protein